MTRALKIDDVAARTGVSPRTVRYYIQRGLLPAPEFKGPDTAYDERHVYGLQAIKRLQEAYWPLEAIAAELAGKPVEALKKLATSGPTEAGKPRTEDAVEPAAVASPSPKITRGTRTTLRNGLELWMDEDADDETRTLAEAIRELALRTPSPNGKRTGGSRR